MSFSNHWIYVSFSSIKPPKLLINPCFGSEKPRASDQSPESD